MAELVIQRGRFFQKYDLTTLGASGLSIGRAYACDMVLEDRFVDPVQAHLSMHSDPTQANWMLSVKETTNPVFLNGKLVQSPQVSLVSGDRLTLGRTTLQLFASDHDIPRTDRFVLSNWLTHHAIGPWRALLALIAVMALALLTQYLTHYEENQWRSFVSGTLIPPGVLIVWVCIWSFVGRLLRGHPLFFPHLFFAGAGACVSLLLWDIHGYVAFVTGNEWLALIADTAAFAIVVGLTLGCHLSLASRIRHVFASGVLTCFGLAMMVGMLSVSGQEQWTAQAQHNTALKAPFVPSPTGISVDAFLALYDEDADRLAGDLAESESIDAERLDTASPEANPL